MDAHRNPEPSSVGVHLGLRWQAQRDTAFARPMVLPDPNTIPPPESAVAAALCRRSPKPGGNKPIHGKVDVFHKIFRRAFMCFVCFVVQSSSAADFAVLKPADFAHHVQKFNAMEDENVTNAVPNAQSWDWLQKEVPFFECPDKNVEEMYYFRWWSFRKHLVHTTDGWVVTEFLTPVSHAGKFNTVSCATGFHIAEGRWLRAPIYINDYIRFWLRGNGGHPQPHFHKFSSWLAASVWDRYCVTGDQRFILNLLPDLVADYQVWERERLLTNGPLQGMFWQFDVRDGMEESISGARRFGHVRPTINSYMAANAGAIAGIARLAGNAKIAGQFAAKSARLKTLVQEKLWNPELNFFVVRQQDGSFADVREELGYIPWMFNLPADDQKYSLAWKQLGDPQGFAAPFGITTAERRHPQFRSHGVGTCEWDGAIWPFATSQTLYALANFLRDYQQQSVTRLDYFNAVLTYTRSQHANGKPYIGEYLDEVTGDWINGKGGRSRYYNHSTYADLLITGVVGLVPRAVNLVELNPLLPPGVWDWFCLDGVSYHGHTLTILWDKDGSRYGRGSGLQILVDGKQIARAQELKKITGQLP
jgi:hypothetical protein